MTFENFPGTAPAYGLRRARAPAPLYLPAVSNLFLQFAVLKWLFDKAINDTLITGGGLVEYDLQLIGARLQAARKAKGYTQDYVSARADITEKFLSQIERGKAGLSVQTLIALCDILEITPNYVLLPDAARVLEEPIGPLLKGMSQRQLQDVEEMVRIFVRNCRHEEKGRPRGGRRNMR